MADVVLAGGSVLAPEGVKVTDVVIDGGLIGAIGSYEGAAARTIDCTGLWVGPSFVDLHSHFREPGQEWKEDIASGSSAAAAGGYGAVVAMPNTEPAIDSAHLARFVAERGSEVGLVDVIPAGCITMGRKGVTMAHLDDLWTAGVRMFTDDGDSVENAALMRAAMEYIAALGGVVSQHAIDPHLSSAGFMHEGTVSSRLGMYGIPREADDITLARDIALAKLTGVRYHVQHLSTKGSVDLVRDAKRSGVAITAEVTPHHLAFDDTDLASADPDFKMMPPLRDAADRTALIEGLREGVIDVIGTDHAPHSALEKEVPFEEAPNGVLGLEWAASVAVGAAGLDQEQLFDRLSVAPARIAGLDKHGKPLAKGAEANIVVFDPDETWTPTTSRSKSRNAPYLGRTMTGRVRTTMLRGAITYAGDEVGNV